MIEIYLLEQLAAVAEHGTLLKAAQALYLSQPALSRSMKKLETQLGVSLFDRDNSRIALNKTGLHAVEYAKRILELDREMCEGVADFDRRQRTVSVGACAPFPLGELTPVIQERYIQMAVTTELADDERLLSGLRNRVYQLAILHESQDAGCLVSHHRDVRISHAQPDPGRRHDFYRRRIENLLGMALEVEDAHAVRVVAQAVVFPHTIDFCLTVIAEGTDQIIRRQRTGRVVDLLDRRNGFS